MSSRLSSSLRPLWVFLPAAALLSGCYTQLASRGYQAGSYPPEAYAGTVPDSLMSDSALAAADSAARAAGNLQGAPGSKAPTVIVNNYYDPYPSYRGYAHWEWDYPLISFGYYSSRYDRFHRPWWWDDPWYRHRRHHHYHGHGPHRPSTPAPAPSGPYKSPKRLYNDEPTYRPVQKGRRSEQAQEPAPAAPTYSAPVYVEPPQPAPAPAAKSGSDGGSSGSSGGGSGDSSPSGSKDEKDNKQDNDYRSLKKGKRR